MREKGFECKTDVEAEHVYISRKKSLIFGRFNKLRSVRLNGDQVCVEDS